MNRVELRHLPLRAPARWPGLRKAFPSVLLSLFLVGFGLVWMDQVPAFALFPKARWPEAWLLVLATATTLTSLNRQLSGQNVLLVSLLIVLVAAGVESLNCVSGLPFGPCTFATSLGRPLFHVLPWPLPLIWLVALLNSRGVARLALRPWRQSRNYGFWLLGATVLLAVLLDFGLQPFATHVELYWSWKPTRLPSDWYGTPWVNFLGRGVTLLLLMAFVTPALINKSPVKRAPDYHPLVVWVSLNTLFSTSAIVGRLWGPAMLVGLGTLLAGALAIRGGVGLSSSSSSSS